MSLLRSTPVWLKIKQSCNGRHFSMTNSWKNKEKKIDEKPPPPPSGQIGADFVTPNWLQKTTLVWTGRFKTKEEIPKYISVHTLTKEANRARIKLSNYLILATILGCLGYVIAGKRAKERGESVQKMNLKWHEEYNKEAQMKAQAQAK